MFKQLLFAVGHERELIRRALAKPLSCGLSGKWEALEAARSMEQPKQAWPTPWDRPISATIWPANNFEPVAQQHSQRRALRVFLGESQRGSGENRCGSRGPLELSSVRLQGLSQNASPSRTQLKRSGASAVASLRSPPLSSPSTRSVQRMPQHLVCLKVLRCPFLSLSW
jgi:hypothetical protein